MKLHENVNFNVSGYLLIKDSNNDIIIAKKNLVVNTAKTIMASSLVGNPACDYIAYLAFGDGTNPPLITDRALYNQIHQVPVSYESQPTPYFEDQLESDGSTTQAATVIYSGIIDTSASFTAKEAGLFSIKEFMFSRLVFPQISKQIGVSWLVRWTLKLRIS